MGSLPLIWLALLVLIAGCSAPAPAPRSQPGVKKVLAEVRGIT